MPDDRCDTYAVDLLDPEATDGWAAHVAERFGGVDALIHLVGGWRGGKPISEAPVEDDEFLHGLLVRSVQTASRAFLPYLVERAGRFVIVSSIQAQAPTATNAAYATAKAGAEAWTLALADESDPKAWLDLVDDDEFPLSIFYTSLKGKLEAEPVPA